MIKEFDAKIMESIGKAKNNKSQTAFWRSDLRKKKRNRTQCKQAKT